MMFDSIYREPSVRLPTPSTGTRYRVIVQDEHRESPASVSLLVKPRRGRAEDSVYSKLERKYITSADSGNRNIYHPSSK